MSRRVTTVAPAVAPVGTGTVLGGGLAELPFVFLGLLAGGQFGAFPIGSGGALVSGLRACISIPSAAPGNLVTVEIWKTPPGASPVTTGASLTLDASTRFLRGPANAILNEGDVLFLKITSTGFVYDAWHITVVTEF